MYCTNCGKQLDDDVNFCIHCGEKIKDHEENKPQETINPNEISNEIEKELYFSPKEKIRKTGEKRYGKGTFKITNQYLYLDYKRKRKPGGGRKKK